MAAIPGHIHDEIILVGCHRDGVCRLLLSLITSQRRSQLGYLEQLIQPAGQCLFMKLFEALGLCSRRAGNLSEQVKWSILITLR
jgi:hypothetical protein